MQQANQRLRGSIELPAAERVHVAPTVSRNVCLTIGMHIPIPLSRRRMMSLLPALVLLVPFQVK
jgi:hypothetical protein